MPLLVSPMHQCCVPMLMASFGLGPGQCPPTPPGPADVAGRCRAGAGLPNVTRPARLRPLVLLLLPGAHPACMVSTRRNRRAGRRPCSRMSPGTVGNTGRTDVRTITYMFVCAGQKFLSRTRCQSPRRGRLTPSKTSSNQPKLHLN
jgi:hypothetical protein